MEDCFLKLKSIILVLLSIMCVTNVLPAFSATIAISDLDVQTANPNYKFIGKGIAELLSFELSKSKDVTVISREKRAEMLKEVEFAMLTDEQQLKMGKMLAAEYIVTGNIIDMAEVFIITIKLVDVQTGKIMWQDKKTEKISKYDYISAYFASGVLKALNTMADTSTIAKLEKKQEKNEQAVVAFSKAVDAIDRNDTNKARSQLNEAKQYDPENDLIRQYIAKLSVTSSKFKVELDFYVPSQNPAVLGTIQQDKIYWILCISQDNLVGGKVVPKDVGDGYKIDEAGNVVNRIGYEFPLGQRWGMNVEFMFSSVDPKLQAPYTFYIGGEHGIVGPTSFYHPITTHFGLALGVGYALNEWLSLGLSLAAYSTHARQEDATTIDLRNGSDGSFGSGFLLTLLNKQLYIDTLLYI